MKKGCTFISKMSQHQFFKNESSDLLTGKNSKVNLKVIFCFFQVQKMTPLEEFLLSERLRKRHHAGNLSLISW
jgi:hypothetical protein